MKIWYFDLNLSEVCSQGLIDDKSVLVQVMACRGTGDKPLPEPKLMQIADAYMQH